MGRGDSSRIRDVTERHSPPGADELELAIIGPGYGESVVVHTGGGRWAVVDSCVNARTGVPHALEYLDALGVDPADSVDLVVATHWHADHVGGLGRLTTTCRRAVFCCPVVFTNREVLTFVGAMAGHDVGHAGASTKEMREVLSVLRERKVRPRFAIANRRILRQGDCVVWSLSPGDGAVVRYVRSASSVQSSEDPTTTLPRTLSPNQTSVALWIKIRDVAVVLGSDLEKTGWIEVLDSTARPQGRASVLKVSHHGSANAHEPRLWDEMMTKGPVAVVTPFRGSRNPPPTRKDLQRVLRMTSNAYITAEPRAARSIKALNRRIGRRFREMPMSGRPSSEPGMVRLRRGLESSDGWKVTPFGGACHLQEYLTRTAHE